jgi:hypothetical protein
MGEGQLFDEVRTANDKCGLVRLAPGLGALPD